MAHPAKAPLPASVLEALKKFDTPTICNAMEIVAPERRLYGYTVKPLVCPMTSGMKCCPLNWPSGFAIRHFCQKNLSYCCTLSPAITATPALLRLCAKTTRHPL